MKTTNVDQFGFLIHDVARLLRRRFEDRGRQYGLSAAQWRALVHLVKRGPMTQARLAEFLEIEPISVSRLIDRMSEGGWVERRPDESDRRANLVIATDKATETFSSIKAMAGDIFDAAMEGISTEDRVTLVSALAIIAENLSDTETISQAEPTEKARP